jgi:hypothetical protein
MISFYKFQSTLSQNKNSSQVGGDIPACVKHKSKTEEKDTINLKT